MAQSSKWKKMRVDVETKLEVLNAMPNLTAEQVGMRVAYMNVLVSMNYYERLEKKFDKS